MLQSGTVESSSSYMGVFVYGIIAQVIVLHFYFGCY